MKTDSPQSHYDIAIIGGGLVGASLACALQAAITDMRTGARAQPLRVLVTEAAGQVGSSPSFDARSTALSYGSQQIYQRLGLWDRLASNATPIRRIHVSDRGHFGAVRIESEAMKVEALGHVIENRHLGEALMEALTTAPDIDFLCPASIASARHSTSGMTLEITVDAQELPQEPPQEPQKPREITASLVVLADGGKSSLCQQLGIGMRVENYGQKAIIANVAFEKSHDNIAYERFTDSGPLAVLPLATLAGDNRGALIWTLSHEDADATIALSDEDFLAALQKRFGYRLGMFEKVGKRASYPLSLTVAQEQVRPGLVLLGNVAHTLHPVAGQGLNLALRDAQALAELIVESCHDETVSPGTMSVLQRFVASQQPDQDLTIDFSHYMTRLFSSSNPALVWARKFGMFSVDLLPLVKRSFARQAMGMGERKTRAVV